MNATVVNAPKFNLYQAVTKNWLLPTLVVAALGYWLYTRSRPDHREALPPEDHIAAAEENAPTAVTAEPVARRSVQRSVEAVGSLWGFEEIVLSAKVEGRVKKIHHEIADRVAPNELLVEIDPTDFDLAVRQAESGLHVELAKFGLAAPEDKIEFEKLPAVVLAQAKLENAVRRLDRVKTLVAKNAVSAEESENVGNEVRIMQAELSNQMLLAKSGQATIRMKESALATAQQQLKDTQLRAPTPTRSLPGYEEGLTYLMTKRSVAEGTFVRVGGEIGRLALDKVLKLRVPVPERFSAQVKLGQRAEVRTAAYEKPFAGVVTLINPAVESATRTFDVEIQVANPRGELKPGSFAKAIIETHRQDDAPTVPLAAVLSFAGVTKIFLLENGAAREVPVTLGVQTREWVEIATPKLPANAQVITSGHTNLATDAQVAIRGETTATSHESSQLARRPQEAPAQKNRAQEEPQEHAR